jgi:hypothetical protein
MRKRHLGGLPGGIDLECWLVLETVVHAGVHLALGDVARVVGIFLWAPAPVGSERVLHLLDEVVFDVVHAAGGLVGLRA